MAENAINNLHCHLGHINNCPKLLFTLQNWDVINYYFFILSIQKNNFNLNYVIKFEKFTENKIIPLIYIFEEIYK